MSPQARLGRAGRVGLSHSPNRVQGLAAGWGDRTIPNNPCFLAEVSPTGSHRSHVEMPARPVAQMLLKLPYILMDKLGPVTPHRPPALAWP